jgi:superoxide oxidase
MSAEVKSTAERQPEHVASYDGVLKGIHWVSLLFVGVAFLAVWASDLAPSREQSAMLLELHRSLGITVFGLTLFRLAWRWHTAIPALPAELPGIQKIAARTAEYSLHVLLLLQPILGILHTNARGRRIGFYFVVELPAVIGPDKALAKRAMAMHELIGYVLLALIALHAAAALFHHYLRRDDVLRTMMPRRR